MDQNKLQIGIIGSGALGSLFAAKLAPLADVVMLGHWPEQIAVLQTSGLTLINPDHTETQIYFPSFSRPAEIPSLDLAIVVVKSRQTRRAAAELATALKDEGLAVTLQNGLGNMQELAAILGPERVAQGTTTQAASMMEPGIVRHAGQGPTVLQQVPASGIIGSLAELLNRSGMGTALSPDIRPELWGKLAISSAINPLTALLRVRNGFLADDDQAREVMGCVADETASVAEGLGIILPYPSAAARSTAVATATAPNISSMLQDVMRGEHTEIDYICGAVAQLGSAVSIPTPWNDELYRLVSALNHRDMESRRINLPQLQELIDTTKELIHDRYRVD